MFATIKRLIDQEAYLAIPVTNLTPSANLYELGLTPFDAIRLFVAIERAFKIVFNREMLNRESVASIEAITKAVQALQQLPAVEVCKAGVTETSRQEVSRILLMGAPEGSLSSDDRAYLARVVAARTGLSQPDAEKRVDALSAQMKTSADKVRAATETARKAGILLAFLTAASMVLGAAAAWWGAGVGGLHRDEKFDASHLTRW
jgi:acyl carrier protein